MNAEERAFPVTVDPTVFSTFTSYCNDLTVYIGIGEVTDGEVLYVSGERVSYWSMSSLPDIPSSAYIVASYIYLQGFLDVDANTKA